MIEFETQVEIDKLKQRIRELEVSGDFAKARITNVGSPKNGTDAATKRYVDDTVKASVESLRIEVLALRRKVG